MGCLFLYKKNKNNKFRFSRCLTRIKYRNKKKGDVNRKEMIKCQRGRLTRIIKTYYKNDKLVTDKGGLGK